jgi:hypothetical protein
MGEHVDKVCVHVDKVGEHVDKVCVHVDKVGEHVDKVCVHVDKVGEHVDKVVEHIDKVVEVRTWARVVTMCTKCMSTPREIFAHFRLVCFCTPRLECTFAMGGISVQMDRVKVCMPTASAWSRGSGPANVQKILVHVDGRCACTWIEYACTWKE